MCPTPIIHRPFATDTPAVRGLTILAMTLVEYATDALLMQAGPNLDDMSPMTSLTRLPSSDSASRGNLGWISLVRPDMPAPTSLRGLPRL